MQALAQMLEHPQRINVTVTALAAHLQLSESVVYRCYPSKSQMFEALIEFIEHTLFMMINKILQQEHSGGKTLENLLLLLLGFSQKNPGMTRILIGEVLINESTRLRQRIKRLHDRLETTLRQALRFAISEHQLRIEWDVSVRANMLMCFVIGRWYQFVESGFNREPLADWEVQRYAVLPAELL